jgi:hypothetical protein
VLRSADPPAPQLPRFGRVDDVERNAHQTRENAMRRTTRHLATLLTAALASGIATASIADDGDTDTGDRRERIADRIERRGDRAEQRLDRRGDRIDARLDRRAARADELGREALARHLDARGDRIDQRLDRRGERIDRRLDRRGERVERRHDRRARRVRHGGPRHRGHR